MRTVSQINFLQKLEKEIGGHSFPRHQRGPRKTAIVERAFTELQTRAILQRCKANDVTVNNALVVLCNVVWARLATHESFRDPLMMYTAIDLRSRLQPCLASSYWFLALTYYNIVLPSFPPANEKVFWHRTRSVKAQTKETLHSRFLLSRAVHMGEVRSCKARGSSPQIPSLRQASLPPASSSVLLGLSLIGNLDTIYLRSSYPFFDLLSVSTASRQKAGGLLLLQHTFGGKLWLNLCWDTNGYPEGLMERFWQGLQTAVEELPL